MSALTISITRSNIFDIAEGISATISQHNGGKPTFEQLWASDSEAKKLDIYYREAVSDLEDRLIDWATATHSQFDLTATGADYTLTLGMSPYWPSRLEGLLKNKVQDYFVHAVTAGWLNDFEGLTIKNDYQAMGVADLTAILDIIQKREFGFAESARGTNPDEKEDPDSVSQAGERKSDTKKGVPVLPYEAGSRHRDTVKKQSQNPDERPRLTRPCMDRHVDNDIVCHHKNWTDWSGTGMAYMDRMKPMPSRTPDMACMIKPEAKPPVHYPKPTLPPPFDPNHPAYPHHPEEPLPPFHANGKGWSDEERPDVIAEEKFIQNHKCEHPNCGHHGVNKLDWDFENTQEEQYDESTFIEYD